MSRKTMSEEERRRRRNEASRRCYLRRKAELAAQAQPVGAKNKKPKVKAVETKPIRVKPARRGPDPIVAAERLCKTYAKIAAGVKPMIKDAAEFLGTIYKSEDQRVIEKIERILTKGLGISVKWPTSDPIEKTRVCLDVVSKAVKTPKYRLTPVALEPEPESELKPEPKPEDEPTEVPVDPSLIEKVDAGEIDKSEIEMQSCDDKSEDDKSEDDDEEDDFGEDEDYDEDDDSEEALERRREREEFNNVRDYETGRWEMFGEMGAQGAFDD